MSTYVLMTKLSPEVTRNLEERKAAGERWLATIKKYCPEVKWIDHYALLGPYDFMDIYEAPNEEVAAKVSLITHSAGALKAESWTAIKYSRFLKLLTDVQGLDE